MCVCVVCCFAYLTFLKNYFTLIFVSLFFSFKALHNYHHLMSSLVSFSVFFLCITLSPEFPQDTKEILFAQKTKATNDISPNSLRLPRSPKHRQRLRYPPLPLGPREQGFRLNPPWIGRPRIPRHLLHRNRKSPCLYATRRDEMLGRTHTRQQHLDSFPSNAHPRLR